MINVLFKIKARRNCGKESHVYSGSQGISFLEKNNDIINQSAFIQLKSTNKHCVSVLIRFSEAQWKHHERFTGQSVFGD